MYSLSIIVPVYNDHQCIVKLINEIQKLKLDYRLHLIIVDDCSFKPVHLTIEELNLDNFESVVCLQLPCNMGHQFAISEGFKKALELRCDFTIVMDSDGEDLPKSILPLLQKTIETDQITVAARGKRYESIKYKTFYFFYLLIFRFFTGIKLNFGNFSILPFEKLMNIYNSETCSIHLPATILKSKLKYNVVKIDRGKRYFGSSKMNLTSLVFHGLKGLSVFSSTVISRLLIFSAFLIVILVLTILGILILKFTGNASPGWASNLITALFIICFQICSLSFISILNIPYLQSSKEKSIVDKTIKN
jgi:polyisoprenyl-phosphate glycosyltransferase